MLRESQARESTEAVVANHSRMRRQGHASDSLSVAVALRLVEHIPSGATLCVGLSGGVDSVVLLDIVTNIAPRQGWRVTAIHVNHQINARAGEWARFCRTLCRERGVPLKVVKVDVPRGDSVEAAARELRYAAYRAQPAPYVVLAQHQDDQVETVLLQLLRGAGVKGLAAMPVARRDHACSDLTVLRPMLHVTRRHIETYAAARSLRWVEDDSNTDAYYLRNFLRHEILPRIETRVPAYRITLARAAAQMAEAANLLDVLAGIDGKNGLSPGWLVLGSLRGLSQDRARNLLRFFLARQGLRMPDARRLDEALRQVLTAKADARVCVNLGQHTLRRYRGQVHVVPLLTALPVEFSHQWRGERQLMIPELQGVLTMRRRRGAGIDLEKLQCAPVTLRVRRGGEKLQPDATRPRRTLKALFQTLDMPPWQRERMPLLWSGERLVWVAGLGIDTAFVARRGAPGVEPQWLARHEGEWPR